MTTQANQPDFLAVDFYCGAGGATRGLIDAGGYVIAGIDKDEWLRKTYEANNAPSRFIAKDIVGVEFTTSVPT